MTLSPSGIYSITNTKNGKVYIGQSENVYLRRAQHTHALKHHNHPNEHLQKDYNKYGASNFVWRFVEQVGLSQLNDREHYWIEKLNTIWPKGYNIDWKPYKRKKTDVKKKGYKYKGYRKRS